MISIFNSVLPAVVISVPSASWICWQSSVSCSNFSILRAVASLMNDASDPVSISASHLQEFISISMCGRGVNLIISHLRTEERRCPPRPCCGFPDADDNLVSELRHVRSKSKIFLAAFCSHSAYVPVAYTASNILPFCNMSRLRLVGITFPR